MTTKELKKSVIEKLGQVEEPILKNILALLKFEISTELYKLNSLERASVELGIQQIENGEYISHEQVNRETEIWLKE